MSPDARAVGVLAVGRSVGARERTRGARDTGRPRPWGETSEASPLDYTASCRVVRDLHA